MALGGTVSFTVGPEEMRACTGVRRAGRRSPCPYDAGLPHDAKREQCPRCSALDRSSSVAADTYLDDPRPYAVYLAYFGPGLHKVGITAVQRGTARLLEQAAVCFTFLGEGPLMTARRTEAVLGAALRVPDRVPDPAKRSARHTLPAAGERAAELRDLYGKVAALRGRLPDSLRLRPFALVDHATLFGFDGAPPPAAEVTAIEPGRTLSGRVLAVAGHDVHIRTPGAVLLLDTRLTAGWPLRSADPYTPSDVPTTPVRRPTRQPDALF